MSSNDKQQLPAAPGSQQGNQQYFPPPPPGPPPIQTSHAPPQASAPKHSNETPLPDYNIPAYDPAHPRFAPPLGGAEDDIYNATPTDDHPPKWGQHSHHDGNSESEGEHGKKKPSKFSALGAAFSSKVAGPVNALAQKFGSEGFLPESLDKECEKAARILRGFCKDGIYGDAVPQIESTAAPAATNTQPSSDKPPASPSGKPKKPRVLLTIPSKVIARAQGIAIFTAVRLGFHATGSSGSGVLLARLPDGSWSPPSGIQVTSIGAGFVAGVDIYDCVIVINTREALDLFTKTRLSLGSDLAVTAGPFGAGGALDWGVPAGGSSSQNQNQTQPPQPGRGRDSDAKHPATTNLAPPQPQQRPLSADNTHFQTSPVPEHQQGMGSDDDDPKHADKHGKNKDRKPSPFRDAIRKPVYSYVKSRGLFAGVQIDGTVIAERDGANARFYGAAVPAARILRGELPSAAAAHGSSSQAGVWPAAAQGLFDVLRGAEGGWRGQQGQGVGAGAGVAGAAGRPVSPAGFVPAASPGASNTGAPPSAWVPPPSAAAGTSSGPGVVAGMQNLSLAHPRLSAATSAADVPPPQPPRPTAAAEAKAAEAAAEAARAEQYPPPPPPPPEYSQHGGAQDDLPPAYDEQDAYRPAGAGADSKTGLH